MTNTDLDLDRYLTDPTSLIAEQLILPTGDPYGAVWQPFQRSMFEAIFATDDRLPRHRLVYDERRRGESKTEDSAAAALADLFTGPAGHRSYAVAGDQDQAALILDSVRGFQLRSPILASIQIQRSIVRNTETGAELRVMSSDAPTAYGLRPRKVFFDELSLQTEEALWTAMWTAIGKNPSSQLIATSMAGSDFTSLGYRIRELARTTPAYHFATREGSELAPWLTERDMEEQRRTLHPALFAMYWECRWTEPRGAWITVEMFNAAETGQPRTERSYTGGQCVGFVDVGLVHDATAVAVCRRDGDRVILDALETLQGSRNEPVQLEVLEDLVTELTQRLGVTAWRFEAPQAVASVQRLQGRLRGASVEARYPTADTQARLFGTLYRLFADHKLVLFPHERLRKETLSLVTKTVGGRLKVVDSGSIHQDHVIAVGGAAEMLFDPEAAEVRLWWIDSETDLVHDSAAPGGVTVPTDPDLIRVTTADWAAIRKEVA